MKISIVMASRKKGNPNSNFIGFLESLLEFAADVRNIEVLVKLDDDDDEHPLRVGGITDPIVVKTIITPRGLGYTDLHKAYADLLSVSDPESELFWVLSDDALIKTQAWDVSLLNIASAKKNTLHVINTTRDIDTSVLSVTNCIAMVDTYPVWTRPWLSVAGCGHTFNTDGFTGLLCFMLERYYHLPKSQYRSFCPIDVERGQDGHGDDERWNGTRKWQIRRMENTLFSSPIHTMIKIKASVMAAIIKGTVHG